MAKRTDQIISVGENVKQDLIRVGIGSENQYTVIHPAIDITFQDQKSSLRQKNVLDPNEIVVGWLGRIVPIKRPDLVLSLAVKFPLITFLVGGGGELEAMFSNELPKNLKFIGWTRPEEFWPMCDLAILTSDNEGLPTALIEAGLYGLPVVARNVGSVSEIVINNFSGFTVKDTDEMAEKISQLCTNPELRRKMGQNSKDWCLSEFNVDKFLEKHMLLYKNLKTELV